MSRSIVYLISFFCFLSTTLLIGCQDSIVLVEVEDNVEVDEQPNEPTNNNGAIIITDRTGREWDITHAVRRYGFEADKFQFGLGVDAIPPLINPEMLSEGEDGYPDPDRDANILVMGAAVNGIARAYPLTAMSRHEVVDTDFGGKHVAVAY